MRLESEFDFKVLQQITPRNLLSFGPETVPLELERLSVLFGPNGAAEV